MTIPDTAAYAGLKTFLDPKNLAFRAACTGVVPPLHQIIRARVILRIHESDEARAILVRLWDTLLASSGSVSDHKLADALTEDLCWKTLVHEEVVAIHSMYRHNNPAPSW